MNDFSSNDIRFERRGSAGIVMLERPAALNALTLDMVRRLYAQLLQWRNDPAVTRVVVTAAGDRAFCAGGDIRWLYERGRAGHLDEAYTFWREEYILNTLIKRYPKPYVSLIDGIVMGGGVGISVHGSHRVAGNGYLFAMPEVGIGLFPDVGATWFMPRLPGALGYYCVLTGARLRAGDAVAGQVATHHVPSSRFRELLDVLCEDKVVDDILAAFEAPIEAGPAASRHAAIERLFVGDRIEDILARLDTESGENAEWARDAAARMRAMAPLSMKVALAQLRHGRSWSFEDCMRVEFRLVTRLARRPDFYEGIRALIIDKDNRPTWQPASLAAVDDAEVERCFAPIDDELVLP